MKRLVVFTLLGVLAVALLCLGAFETLTNRTGKTATGVVITFSEAVRISSYDESTFPDQSPSGRADEFTFSGATLANGGRFKVSWSPSSAEVVECQWVVLVTQDSLPAATSGATSILGDEFIIGARLSGHSIIKREWDGCWRTVNPLQVLKAHGFEWVFASVRTESSAYLRDTPPAMWSSLPWRGEYWESVEITEQLLREAQDAGMKLCLYLELSDQPTYSANQHAPKAWRGLSVDETATKLGQYVLDTVRYFAERGIDVAMYSLSGEIEWGILDFAPVFQQGGGRIPVRDVPHMELLREDVWPVEAKLLSAAASAIRAADPDALVLLYVASEPFIPSLTGLDDMATAFFEEMVAHGVDFDVAGFSWPYPYALGAWPFPVRTLEWVWTRAAEIARTIGELGKPVIIAEAGYPSSPRGVPEPAIPGYPYSLEGQAAWVKMMLSRAESTRCIGGFIYFCPEWLPRPYYTTDQDFQMDGNSLFLGDETTKPALDEFAAFSEGHPE